LTTIELDGAAIQLVGGDQTGSGTVGKDIDGWFGGSEGGCVGSPAPNVEAAATSITAGMIETREYAVFILASTIPAPLTAALPFLA
jgi:hypothetical protein